MVALVPYFHSKEKTQRTQNSHILSPAFCNWEILDIFLSLMKQSLRLSEAISALSYAQWVRSLTTWNMSILNSWIWCPNHLSPSPIVIVKRRAEMFHLTFRIIPLQFPGPQKKGSWRQQHCLPCSFFWTWHYFWHRECLNKYLLTD